MSKRRKKRGQANRPLALAAGGGAESLIAENGPGERDGGAGETRADADVSAGVTGVPRVRVVHSWKDTLGQSALIVFSVVLALVLTEAASAIREQRQTDEVVANVRTELMRNRAAAQELQAYNQSVLRRLEVALGDAKLQQEIVAGGEFRLERIAPDGVLYRYLSDVAWEVAKSRNIAAKLPLSTWSLLTRIYADQARTMKVEDEVAKIVLGAEGRKAENIRQTLLLIRDNYRGWAVDRAPALLKRYDEAIAALERR